MDKQNQDVKETQEGQASSTDQSSEPQNNEQEDNGSENKIPYSRFKEVNSEKKQLEEELKKYKDKIEEASKKSEKSSDNKSKSSNFDVDSIIEVQEATKDLNQEEISELKLRANAKDVSLMDARKDDNFQTWLEAKRAKVAKQNKTPEPDSKKAPTEKSFEDYTLEDYQQLPDEKKIEYNNWRKKQPEGKQLGF